MRPRKPPTIRSRERGAVLFVSLILLLVLTLIGVTAARMQTVEERMSQNDSSYALAVQSGEAVLRYSEQDISNYAAGPPCPNANGQFCIQDEVTGGTYQSYADQNPTNFSGQSIAYPGPQLTSVQVTAPQYLVEYIAAAGVAGGGISNTSSYGGSAMSGKVFRTTTLATGADPNAYAKVLSVGQ